MRAVLRACQEAGVDCHLHDRGSAIDRFARYVNDLPHSVGAMEARIRSAWEQAGENSNREDVASKFFEDRRRGEIRNWYRFLDGQEESLLPAEWNPDKHNIAVFPSSEDEFAAIGEEWRNPLYADQEEGLQRVVGDFRGVDGVDLWLRLHPNLRGVSNDSLDRVAALDGGNIHVITADSPVSSYALLLESDVVLSFGSTMGIEATFWGKPSVLAGACFYRSLDATTNPADHQGVLDLLLDPPPPCDRTGALVYGYFFATYGEPFEFFRPDSLRAGAFRGRRIGPGPIGYRVLRLLASPAGAIPRRWLAGYFERRARNRVGGSEER
jgi:hypothetical protein